MELYKIIATCTNNNESFIFDYLPENFEGVKISQNFTFQIPIGYNPKFSVDTMRIIRGNAFTVDTWFLTYGLETDVEIEIQKLNATGTAYEFLSTFAIDFETYEIQEHFSEFALKSISVMDFYNNNKNTETQIELTETCDLPNTQKLINYVSLKKTVFDKGNETLIAFVAFEKNNESKIYNGDTSLFSDLLVGNNTIKNGCIYKFEDMAANISLSISANCNLNFSWSFPSVPGSSILRLKLYKNNFNNPVYTFYQSTISELSATIQLQIEKLTLSPATYSKGDVLFIAADLTSTAANVFNGDGDLFFDLKIETNLPVLVNDSNGIKYTLSENILNHIFNNNLNIIQSYLGDLAVTSSQHLLKLSDFAVLKPREFLNDFCIATGAILNFKKTGFADINTITAYFNDLLKTSNAVEITDYKEFSITYNKDLNYSSVSAGCDPKEYDVYSYPIDWNKVLTFSQANRNASENLDLTLQKLRVDFSGMLDLFYKRSQQSDLKVNENYLFRPDFALVDYPDQITPELNLYDHYNPRAILDSWGKFLSFFFQNFGKNTLTISSNGGTTDNLDIHSISQMDNLTLNQTPRLLPIEVNFKALIPPDIDFSEKILKVTHDSEIFYIFVINSETTDKLSEQQIKGLKIQMA